MKQQLLKFLIRLIPFSLILFGLHYFLIFKFYSETTFYYSIYAIYSFHFLATLLIYFLLLLVHSNAQDKTGFAFMGSGLLKMLAAVIFLLPMMLSGINNPFDNILSFFIPYLLYLIFETTYAVNLLNNK
ncbi:DUF6168 family protein [Gillisia sp. M10.2A]|uniref:DUF6168 family protein n=1 Tax=Gillisia lutea TaxID=2909668 RepID=A0ABS9ECR3_9FLAO|nr:DUF6168 family protein [Gillisia lutea]MCF4100670.1 DUF6168 family protein [Gillisia lutea]